MTLLSARSTVLLVVVLCVAAFGVVSVSAGGQLEGTLSAGSAPNKVVFTLKNLGKEPLTILTWGTPLEKKFRSRLFKVYAPGSKKPAVYKGRIVKRSLKRAKDSAFITLKGKAQTTAELDLLEAYDLKKGKNRIKIDFDVTVVKRKAGKITDSDIFPLSGELTVTLDRDMTAKPANKPKKSSETNTKKSTDDDKSTDVVAKKPVLGSHRAKTLLEMFSASRVRAVTYNNCLDKENSIKAAVATARDLLTQSRTYLDLNCVWDERFETFFGPNTVASRTTVRGVINAIRTNIHTFKVMCVKDGTEDSDCDDAYAWATPGDPDREVYICRNSWDMLPDTHNEEGTKAGTIIHELSHFHGTDDHEYTEPVCKKLAQRDSAKAVNNADSYLFFHTLGDAIPNACAVPPAVTACAGNEKAFLSAPLDNCEDLYRSTFNAQVKVTDKADNTKSATELVKGSSQGIGVYWKAYRLGKPLFGLSDLKRIRVREAVHAAGRKCCIMGCKRGAKFTNFQAFARAAGKDTCDVSPDA